jgi:acyl-CoA thioesterase I
MKRLFHIIAFGDSLTVGYQSPTWDCPTGRVTPYGRYLQEILGNTAKVSVRGINGELTSQMVSRFERDVISRRPDTVVILGGTNDLGWGIQPEEIMKNLAAMYELATSSQIQPVAVTVPSIRGHDSLIPARQQLNQLIFEYCQNQKIPCVDLFTATAEPETLRLAEPYSNDGLHLTTEGYRLLAERMAEQVFQR